MGAFITNYQREHILYDVNKNPIVIYRTDEEHAVNGGMCQVEKRSWNIDNDMVDSYRFVANVWQAAWNLDATLP